MSPRLKRAALGSGLLLVVFLSLVKFPAEKERKRALPPDSVARAIVTSDPQLLTESVAEHLDVNARDAEGCTPLMLAIEKGDRALVVHLLELGANVEAADANGATPLMMTAAAGDTEILQTLLQHHARTDALDVSRWSAVHHAVAARRAEAVSILMESIVQLDPGTPENPDLLAMACATENRQIVAAVLQRAPANLEWTTQTRRALDLALEEGDEEVTRLLLSKHPAGPTLEGRNVPLLAQAILDDEIDTCDALLAAGVNPNAAVPTPMDKEFLKQLPATLRDYAKADEGITPLMIAAGTGRPDMVRLLLDAGADRNRMTKRYKMLALYFAVHTQKYRAVQMLLGSGPTPENLRIEISLATQRVSVIKDGSSIFQTQCSTGRQGFATPPGSYVITDKTRDHISSIYKVNMPYFMRLNCRDFGMHEGVVPNYPASHGCIRLPSAAAKKFFSEIPVGTVVMIN